MTYTTFITLESCKVVVRQRTPVEISLLLCRSPKHDKTSRLYQGTLELKRRKTKESYVEVTQKVMHVLFAVTLVIGI